MEARLAGRKANTAASETDGCGITGFAVKASIELENGTGGHTEGTGGWTEGEKFYSDCKLLSGIHILEPEGEWILHV